MHDPFVIFLIVSFCMSALFVAVALKARGGASKSDLQMQKLAESLGIGISGGEPVAPNIPFLKNLKRPLEAMGALRGRQTRVWRYTVSHGKSSTTYTAISVLASNQRGLKLSIGKESFLSKIGKTLGMQDVQVGDPLFDQTFVVKCDDPTFIQAALLPEIRQKALAFAERGMRDSIKLDKTQLSYREVGVMRTDAMREKYEAAADLLCDLAAAVELYNSEES